MRERERGWWGVVCVYVRAVVLYFTLRDGFISTRSHPIKLSIAGTISFVLKHKVFDLSSALCNVLRTLNIHSVCNISCKKKRRPPRNGPPQIEVNQLMSSHDRLNGSNNITYWRPNKHGRLRTGDCQVSPKRQPNTRLHVGLFNTQSVSVTEA